MLAGGDELLDAVQHEMVAVARGAGGDRRGVGTGVRLGQAEAAEHVATGERLQVFLLLFVAAVLHRDAAGQRVLHADDGRGGAIAGGDLLQHQHQAHVVHAGTVPFFGHGDAHGAEGAEFPSAPRPGRCGCGPISPAEGARRSCAKSRIASRIISCSCVRIMRFSPEVFLSSARRRR